MFQHTFHTCYPCSRMSKRIAWI